MNQEKKERLIKIGIEEYINNNFDNASLNIILKKAEISKGSFYHEFNSKLDLYIYIIEYISKLDKVDTKNIKPTSQTTGLLDAKREDLINQKDCLTLEEALSGTENTHNGYFKVSAILEK